MILVIDNYDSFTWNLVQYLRELGVEVCVARNDELSAAEALGLGAERVLISPGPGRPSDAGISMDLIRRAPASLPILGVCLGHQCIAEVFGGRVVAAQRILHGKTSRIAHDSAGLFAGLPEVFEATRYHSLVVDAEALPDCLEASAWTADEPRELMALRHRSRPIFGVQFHPESILTAAGRELLANFLKVPAQVAESSMELSSEAAPGRLISNSVPEAARIFATSAPSFGRVASRPC